MAGSSKRSNSRLQDHKEELTKLNVASYKDPDAKKATEQESTKPALGLWPSRCFQGLATTTAERPPPPRLQLDAKRTTRTEQSAAEGLDH